MRPVSVEIVGKGTPYFRLYQFLGCWFPDNEDRPVEDVVSEFVAVDVEDARQVVIEGAAFLSATPFGWEVLPDLSNVYMEDEPAARIWLERAIATLEQRLEGS